MRTTTERSSKLPVLALRGVHLALLLGGVLSAPAWAGPNDSWHPYVAIAYSHDSNLLRVADDQPAFDNVRADAMREVTGGLSYDQTFGRQHVLLQGKLTRVNFDHFTQLNYDGKDFSGLLNWKLGNHLEGNAGASYNQVLAPYNDFNTNERNLRSQRRLFVDGGWRFHPDWRLRGSLLSDKYSYDLLSQRFNNHTTDVYEMGIDYLSRAGGTVGVQLRRLDGKYPNTRTIDHLVIDDGFTQDEAKLKVDWRLTSMTQLQFLGGWVRRNHVFFTNRDSSGGNGRVNVVWSPRYKLSFTTSAWREYAPVESSLASYSLNKGASLASAYALSDRIRIDATVRSEKRDFAGLVLSDTIIGFNDSSRYGSLGLTYALYPSVQLGVSAFHDARTGASVYGKSNYKANGYTLNATAQF